MNKKTKDRHTPLPKANKGKKLNIQVHGKVYARYPVRTHKITRDDVIEKIIKKYVSSLVGREDIVCISERIIAIMQGRSFPIESIKPSLSARLLSKFVTDHPGGIGLRSPWTMELALREAGLIRLLIASVCSAVTKPLGIKGLFYHIAGNDINAIDGPCEYTLPPGNTHAKLGPQNPKGVAESISGILGCGVAIIDANDYGVRVLGVSEGIQSGIVSAIFRDNPLGQSREQTPIAIVRKT